MKYFVRLKNNRSLEVVKEPDDSITLDDWKLRFHPSFEWVSGDVNTEQHDVYDPATKTFRRYHASDDYTLDEYKALALENVRRQCADLILETYPLFVQLNIADSTYPDTGNEGDLRVQMQHDKAAAIEASNVSEDAIDVAATHDEVDAVIPGFPTFPITIP